MKAFVLCAGLGTRLRPWTLTRPKALVPVGGVPMLERVILRLKDEGFTRIVVNVHHFASQIQDFLDTHDFGVKVLVSDERAALLDTGGALLHAAPLLCRDSEPILVHNVDILSNAPLHRLMDKHRQSGAGASLLTSGRDSSRRLVFDSKGVLRGWHNLKTDEWKPAGFRPEADMAQEAFSGIHVINPELIEQMPSQGWSGKFSVIDYYLAESGLHSNILHQYLSGLQLIDIGKPETLKQAEQLIR